MADLVTFNSLALSVKMSILLYVPAILLILWKRQGMLIAIFHGLVSIIIQILLATPFLLEFPRQYFSQAFDLSRVFLYKWTVNWRFFSEEKFLDPKLAQALLFCHLFTLFLFALKWCKQDGGIFRVIEKGFRKPLQPTLNKAMTPNCETIQALILKSNLFIIPVDVATVLMTANLIGITFARSLHYQFYSWYALQVPYLTSQTRLPIVAK